MEQERSSTPSSLTRASSNLELLSQTAAWKNAVENPARVSPAENSAHTSNCVLSPRSNGSSVIDVSLRVSSSASGAAGEVPRIPTATRPGFEKNKTFNMTPSEAPCAASGGEMSQTGTKTPSHDDEDEAGSSSSPPPGLNIASASAATTPTTSFFPAAVAPPYGLSLPQELPSIQSLFRRSSSSSSDAPPGLAASAQGSSTASLMESPKTSQVQRPYLLGPRPHGGAFVETSPFPSILRSNSTVSWTTGLQATAAAAAEGALSGNRTASSTDLSLIDELARDNALLRHELALKNQQIQSMQARMDELERSVSELRQLPVGKISQIPVADMLQLMQTFGSEVSDHTQLPSCMTGTGKKPIQKASIVRQFRRWNPNFHEFFEHKGGKWVPKLGLQGELARRANQRAKRRAQKAAALQTKKKKQLH